MKNLYKKLKSTNKKVFYIFYVLFMFLDIESKAFSIDYEKTFFKKEVERYPIDSYINGNRYKSYIIYGKNKIEEIIDPLFLKNASILKNKGSGNIGSIYIYTKSDGNDVFVSVDSFDLKTESFKIISFYKKDFIESFSNKKDLSYLGSIELDSLKTNKDIKVNQSLSYNIGNISIYSHVFESNDSSLLNKILFFFKKEGYINIYSSFKDNSFLSSMWEFKVKGKKDTGIIYLESFSNNKNLMSNTLSFIDFNKRNNTEIFLYEIF